MRARCCGRLCFVFAGGSMVLVGGLLFRLYHQTGQEAAQPGFAAVVDRVEAAEVGQK